MFRHAALIGFAAGLSVVVATMIEAPAFAVGPPSGATVVGVASATCPSPSFASVTAAVAAAAAGDTIYVCAGTYNEHVVVNKNLTFLGAQFGVDARTGRSDPTAETIIDSATPAFEFAAPATTATISGFTLRGAQNTAAFFAIANAGAGYTFTDNIVTDNSVGMNFNTTGGVATVIRQNRFATNNAPGNDSGTSIFITNGSVHDMTIEQNLFTGNVGDGTSNPADINTPGLPTLDSGVVIRNNQSVDDATFLVLNNSDGTQVTGNTITQTNPASTSNSAIFLTGANPGAVISGNTIDGGTGTAFRASGLTSAVTISNNQVSNRGIGLRFTDAGTGVTISGNTFTNSTNNGIWLESGIAGATVSANTMSSSTGTDCRDDSSGAGTAGTANDWTSDTGVTSTPAGLCAPPPPPTTTTTSPAVGPNEAENGGTDAGSLPATGSSDLVLLAIAAAALVGMGAAMSRARARRIRS